MDFVALDVETSNADLASICAIGVTRFSEGQPVDSIHFLVDPKDIFTPIAIKVHGITPDMVVGAPTMRDVLPIMSRHLAGQIVVHHTNFDRVAIMKAAEKHRHPSLDCRWLDSARVARHAWSDVAQRGYGLRNLAERIGFSFRHHDAREDARAAGLVVVAAIQSSGTRIEDWLSLATSAIRLRPGADPIERNANGPLAGDAVTFTGRLSMPRSQASRMAAAAGCSINDNVTATTTILVVGDQDVRIVGEDGKSAKQRKAEAMIAKGATIKIIRETDFRVLIADDLTSSALCP